MKKLIKLLLISIFLILFFLSFKNYLEKSNKESLLKEAQCKESVSNVKTSLIEGGCSEGPQEFNGFEKALSNIQDNQLNKNIKKLEPSMKTDSNGNTYDANDYLEAPIEGKEPKWNFAKVNVLNTKYGESFVTYQQCSGCHGKLGKTSALNKSKLIGLMKAEDLLTKLKGYRDSDLNQYGVGKVMQKEVKGMTDSDFSNLINQIKNLALVS